MKTAAQYESRTAEERDALILEHLSQVRWIASSIHERLPDSVNEEDLISIGILGLISAVDNYDPSFNASLRTYAEYKIRGAILDSIRGVDGIPGHKRKLIKLVQSAIAAAEQRLQRTPGEEDIAAELGMSIAEYQVCLCDIRAISLGSLDAISSEGGDSNLMRYIATSEDKSPERVLEKAELQGLLMRGIEELPHIERVVIDLYFREELTLQEIGRIVNLHTSRISQLKLQATLRLRTFMKKHWAVSERTGTMARAGSK
jgi:RNA polymerase sigma factor for flagellar operon FliA